MQDQVAKMLTGKYSSRLTFEKVRLQRAVLRALLRSLHRWQPLRDARPGYSILIPCHHRLAEVLLPNLRLVAQQGLPNLDRTVISFDSVPTPRLGELSEKLGREFPGLRLEVLYQSPAQAALIRKIGWAWIDIWLSYCKCLSAAQTRWAMLHDMDAMLLRPGIIERRFETIRQRGDQFLGTHWYVGNGNEPEDEMCFPVEMFVDVAFLRERFKPVHMFNHVQMWNGRTVDFDVMLYPQTRGKRSLLPMADEEMVHPGQVISQYVFLKTKPGYKLPERNNVFFVPYFLHLAGDPHILEQTTAALETSPSAAVPMLGAVADVSRLSRLHADWVLTQLRRVEEAIAGQVRPDVSRYLAAISRHAADNGAASAA